MVNVWVISEWKSIWGILLTVLKFDKVASCLTHHLIPIHTRFVVLASDGIWDFMSSQVCCSIVGDAFQSPETGGDSFPQVACHSIVKRAMSEWESQRDFYRDDITAIVIEFPLFAIALGTGI